MDYASLHEWVFGVVRCDIVSNYGKCGYVPGILSYLWVVFLVGVFCLGLLKVMEIVVSIKEGKGVHLTEDDWIFKWKR